MMHRKEASLIFSDSGSIEEPPSNQQAHPPDEQLSANSAILCDTHEHQLTTVHRSVDDLRLNSFWNVSPQSEPLVESDKKKEVVGRIFNRDWKHRQLFRRRTQDSDPVSGLHHRLTELMLVFTQLQHPSRSIPEIGSLHFKHSDDSSDHRKLTTVRLEIPTEMITYHADYAGGDQLMTSTLGRRFKQPIPFGTFYGNGM
ncbi:unnamed protein product [Anisakis simplex]|uniref:SHSP domain-containing protein n=1 Tax=Anisakis simplex TaxID=6269 RepID=A0A0M3J382_ANISI|nr:unnamed protein product [Anisakis simplex]